HTRWPRDWSSDVCYSDLRFDLGGFGSAAERPAFCEDDEAEGEECEDGGADYRCPHGEDFELSRGSDDEVAESFVGADPFGDDGRSAVRRGGKARWPRERR